MFRSNIWPFVLACSLVAIGAYIGVRYEQYFNQISLASNDSQDYPLWNLNDVSLSPFDSSSSVENKLDSNFSQKMKNGFPSLENVRIFDDFVLAYDKRNRNAHWVFEHLTPENLNSKRGSDLIKSNYIEDKKIHEKFRSALKDYKHSGYDRGHLAAAGNHRHSQRAVDETYTLSNISPQVRDGFNIGIWSDLEEYVRSIARKNINTCVCTGPLYLPRREADGKKYVKYEVIGYNNVAVPTHFFKVIAIETKAGDIEIISFVIPNQPMRDNVLLNSFRTTLDAVERASGLLMFDLIPRNRLKLQNDRTQW